MAQQGRLAWRCRRGMRELDQLLERYVTERYPLADAAERSAFERALELADPQLWAYLLRQEQPDDPALRHVIEQIAGRRV
jgi:antitoxin CptB